MSDNLIGRVRFLLSGSFHALLDKAEDLAPEAALNQHIRQIDKAIDELRVQLGQILAKKHLTTKQINQENNRHIALTDKINIALTKGHEQMARAGIDEQLNIEAKLPIFEQIVVDCMVQEKELEELIKALKIKRLQMITAMQDFYKTQTKSQKDNAVNLTVSPYSVVQNAEKTSNAFDRLMQRQTGVFLQGSDTKRISQLQQLDEFGRRHDIDERLTQFKSKLKP